MTIKQTTSRTRNNSCSKNKAKMNLPAEIMCEILRNLPSKDVVNAKLINKTMNSIIVSNQRSLPRVATHLKITQDETGATTVEVWKSGFSSLKKKVYDFESFDLWTSVNIATLELCSLTSQEKTTEVLEILCDQLWLSKQKTIKAIHFKNVKLSDEYCDILNDLFSLTIQSCQQLIFRECTLPKFLSEDLIQKKSVFDHYRFIDSEGADETNNLVIRKFASDIKTATIKRAFLAEVSGVDAATTCDFIEAWLNAPEASFFNLTIQGCSDEWRWSFQDTCRRRNLENYCYEFPSRTHCNAHIKAVFDEKTSTCRLWPIFDMPAKKAGQTYCSARYFRDF